MSELDSEAADETREEALARALAGRLREIGGGSEAAPSVWEAVIRGERELDEVAREESVDSERAEVYLRPFDADEQAALVDGLLAKSTELEPSEDAGEAEVIPLRRETEPAKPEPAQPAKKPEPEGSYWIVGGMLLAAAAAILLWWVWPRADGLSGSETKLAQVDPLPGYGAPEIKGGLAVMRGDEPESERHRFRRDSEFEWLWRPKTAVTGAVEVRVFAFVEGSSAGLTLRVGELTSIAETGAVRIAGTIDQLGLEPGTYTIALVVGRPESLPAQAEELTATSEPPWQVQRFDIAIESSS